VLISNAGITDDALLLRMDEHRFTEVLDTNLTAAFRVAKRASRSMVRARWGRLVFVSSVVGLSGSAGQAGYSASKSGLVGFSRSLARELGSRGITSNVVAPGFVDTDMTAGLSDARQETIRASIPLGRTASADEVASVIAFLAHDDSSYVTGAVLPVDGGLGMGH
jgi:3-oxoacyl-[acyl-carrier protein] reductase